jgi:ArsR family transcriptional regulator, arsenate/arsenite/antimonite-responsive transcriptional repressor
MTNKIKFDPDILQLAKFGKALSHPVRVFILKKLSGMNACCYSGDLVEELPIGRSALSQHLKELKFSGLIQGETEPPFIKYCINKENWEVAKKLLGKLISDNRVITEC